MKPLAAAAILLMASVFGLMGCETFRASARDASKRTVAIAVTTPDGAPPSPAQLIFINQQVTKAGYIIARNHYEADLMLYVHFVADPASGTGGVVTIRDLRNLHPLEEAAEKSHAFKHESDRANRDMTTEPKE